MLSTVEWRMEEMNQKRNFDKVFVYVMNQIECSNNGKRTTKCFTSKTNFVALCFSRWILDVECFILHSWSITFLLLLFLLRNDIVGMTMPQMKNGNHKWRISNANILRKVKDAHKQVGWLSDWLLPRFLQILWKRNHNRLKNCAGKMIA